MMHISSYQTQSNIAINGDRFAVCGKEIPCMEGLKV